MKTRDINQQHVTANLSGRVPIHELRAVLLIILFLGITASCSTSADQHWSSAHSAQVTSLDRTIETPISFLTQLNSDASHGTDRTRDAGELKRSCQRLSIELHTAQRWNMPETLRSQKDFERFMNEAEAFVAECESTFADSRTNLVKVPADIEALMNTEGPLQEAFASWKQAVS